MPDETAEPQIDESMPGSSPDENDGVTQQLDSGDTLTGQGLQDPLDAGWIPPDRPSKIEVPTEAEQLEGESLEDRLAAEVPDVGDEDEWIDETGDEVGGERSGRLIDGEDEDGSLVGDDVGIDGAGASAEEAAVHIVEAP